MSARVTVQYCGPAQAVTLHNFTEPLRFEVGDKMQVPEAWWPTLKAAGGFLVLEEPAPASVHASTTAARTARKKENQADG